MTPGAKLAFSLSCGVRAASHRQGNSLGSARMTFGCMGQKHSVVAACARSSPLHLHRSHPLIDLIPDRVPVSEHKPGAHHQGDEPKSELDNLDDKPELRQRVNGAVGSADCLDAGGTESTSEDIACSNLPASSVVHPP